jgi:hypothetical protein
MTPEQFWYDDLYLLEIYVNSYMKKSKYESWLQGFYNYQGQMIALGNAFGGKDKKAIEYPMYKDDDVEYIENDDSKPKGNNDFNYLSQCF